MVNHCRREILKSAFLAMSGYPLFAALESLVQTPWSAEERAKFIQDTKVYVTSAFWNDSKDAAKKNKDKYDAVCVPGVGIREDGTLERNLRTDEAFVEDKPLFYIIQNHPEGGDWDASLARAFMALDEQQLKDELSQFKDGIILDLESMTPDMNKEYHRFVEKAAQASDGPCIVSTHAKLRRGEVYGLGKEMDYKAICDAADAMNYMTLDAWPDNPEYPIASLDFFNGTLDTLFEDDIDPAKLIASIPTYIKVSFINPDGSYNEKSPEAGPAKQMLSKLIDVRIEIEEEGQFIAEYNGETVRGWMMTNEAYKARLNLLAERGIDKVSLWYGGQFLENTPSLRQP